MICTAAECEREVENGARMCRSCNAAYQRSYYFANKNARTDRRFGQEKGTYDRMFAEQEGKCACCGIAAEEAPYGRLVMDHDHECCPKGCTKCLRALICDWCNKMLGHGKDNPEILEAGARYIRTYRESRMVEAVSMEQLL